MANFLRGIGYATPAINMTARTMLDYAQEMRNAPLREAESQARVAVSEERLAGLKEQRAREKQVWEEDNAPKDANLVFGPFMEGHTAEEIKSYKNFLKGISAWNDDDTTTNRLRKKAANEFFANEQMTEAWMKGERNKDLRNIDSLKEKLDKAKEANKQEDIDKYTTQLDTAIENYDMKLGNFDKFRKGRAAYKLFQELKGKISEKDMALLKGAYESGDLDTAIKLVNTFKDKAETKPITPYQEKYLETKNRELTLKEKELEYKGNVVGKKGEVKKGEPDKAQAKQPTASQQLKEFNKYLDMHYGSIEGVDPKNVFGTLNTPQKRRYMDILAKGKKYLAKGIDPLEAFNKAKEEVYGKAKPTTQNPQTAPKSKVLVFDPATGEFKEK